jgi:hypothetical protein
MNTVSELSASLPPVRGGHGIGLGNVHPHSILFLSLFRQEAKETLRPQHSSVNVFGGAEPPLRSGEVGAVAALQGAAFFCGGGRAEPRMETTSGEPSRGCAAPLPCRPLFQVSPLS